LSNHGESLFAGLAEVEKVYFTLPSPHLYVIEDTFSLSLAPQQTSQLFASDNTIYTVVETQWRYH